MSTDRDIIERHINACARARDHRGRWRQERACAQQLVDQAGVAPEMAQAMARAATSVGARIAELSPP